MVHGGAWRFGTKDVSKVVDNKIAHWLPKGYIFISINYPMIPSADPLQQADFVGKALAYAQARAKEWGGDPTRFVLMGHSAGAHLVSLISADASIAFAQGAQPWLGVVSLDSAVYDVPTLMSARHFPLYDNAFGSDVKFWREVSPLERLAGKTVPMLLVCSSRRTDSCSQARTFAKKITERGGVATVLPEDLSHGEINENLGIPGTYTEAADSFIQLLGLP
jgi:acetyl esterase/lipase